MLDDIELPDEVQYGSEFGAGMNTRVSNGPSGHELRVQMASQARHRYTLLKQLLDSSEAATLKNFMLGRRFAFAAFLIKDWNDYNTSASGNGPITQIDELVGSGDGTKTKFLLSKTYEKSGPRPYVRRIKNIVTASLVVAVDGVLKTLGFDYTLSSLGEIIFVSPPTLGALITAGFEFRVPVRAEKSVDEWAKFTAGAYDVWNLDNLALVEVLDEEEWPDRRNTGGGRFWGLQAIDIYLNFRDGVLQTVKPTANINAHLPVPTKAPAGYCHFVLWNDPTSGFNIQPKDDAGNNVGSAITPGQTKRYGFYRTSTSTFWIQT